MAKSVASRVKARREALRKAGLRPVQIWVPDTRKSGYLEECRRQSAIVAKADKNDIGLQRLSDTALADLAASGEWK